MYLSYTIYCINRYEGRCHNPFLLLSINTWRYISWEILSFWTKDIMEGISWEILSFFGNKFPRRKSTCCPCQVLSKGIWLIGFFSAPRTNYTKTHVLTFIQITNYMNYMNYSNHTKAHIIIIISLLNVAKLAWNENENSIYMSRLPKIWNICVFFCKN